MPGPIKPKDVQAKKNADIPEEVFKVFNDLIKKAWNGHSATIMQFEAADEVAKALLIDKKEVYDRHLLDVEDAYRKAGWQVVFDKPCYYGGDNYEPHFVFRKKRKT